MFGHPEVVVILAREVSLECWRQNVEEVEVNGRGRVVAASTDFP